MSRVVVFGNGINSMLAVHAASVLGHDVALYSGEKLDEPDHAELLLAPIPMTEAKCASLSVFQHGDPDAMLDKLLNQAGAGRGPEAYDTNVDGRMVWDSNAVYQQLLETYGKFAIIVPEGIDGKTMRTIIATIEPDFAISGVDRDEICSDRNHSFAAASIVTMPTAQQLGNQIRLSGDPDDSWGMESHLFGESLRHYGAHRHPPVSRSKLGGYIIPQGLSCDCFAEQVAFVGKLGAWNHKLPLHDSFYGVMHLLDRR